MGGRELASLHPIFAPELRQVDVRAEFDDPLEENAGYYWGWSQAPVLDPTTHGDAAGSFALWLSERFAARDVSALVPQFEHRAREDASVYPMVPLDLRMRWIAESFDGISDEAWAPMPPNADNIQLRPVAGGRLYQLLDKEGKTLLRTEDHTNETDNHVELPVMIGISKNEFRILR